MKEGIVVGELHLAANWDYEEWGVEGLILLDQLGDLLLPGRFRRCAADGSEPYNRLRRVFQTMTRSTQLHMGSEGCLLCRGEGRSQQ